MSHNIDFATYKTTEQVVGTWIDGKPIYRKTIDFGYLPNGTTKAVAHNIVDIDKIIKIEQTIDNGSSYQHGFLVLSSGAQAVNQFNIYGTNSDIRVATNSDRSTVYAYFTLYYTKVTD